MSRFLWASINRNHSEAPPKIKNSLSLLVFFDCFPMFFALMFLWLFFLLLICMFNMCLFNFVFSSRYRRVYDGIIYSLSMEGRSQSSPMFSECYDIRLSCKHTFKLMTVGENIVISSLSNKFNILLMYFYMRRNRMVNIKRRTLV